MPFHFNIRPPPMESTTWFSDLEVDEYNSLMGLCTQENVHFNGEVKGDKIRREEDSPYSNGSKILSFGVSPSLRDGAYKKMEEEVVVAEMNLPFYMASKDGDGEMSFDCCKRSSTITSPRRRRTSSHSQHHIIAERKRREKLSLRFGALSSLVPGLKKMDKASVLGEAIKYVKQLQERVKSLEEETMTRCMESVVTVKKSRILEEDDENSSVDDCYGELLPEIEVRVSQNDVLVKIHCVNRQGNYSKILCEIQKLDLTIVSTSAVKFGNYAIDITIAAEMKPGCGRTVKDIARELRLTLRN